MEGIVKQYQKIIDKIYDQTVKEGEDKATQVKIKQIYKDQGSKLISKANNKLKIIMDNDFAAAIVKKVIATMSKYSGNFKKLQSVIKFLNSLAKVVMEEKFITVREFKKVENQINEIKNKREYQINTKMKMLQKSEDVNEFRADFFDSIKFADYDEIQTMETEQIAKFYRKFYKQSLDQNNKNFLERTLFVKIDSIISKFQQQKKELLGVDLFNQVQDYFGQQIGKDDKQLQLNKYLSQTAESESLQSNQQHLQLINQQFEEIKKILNKFSGMKLFSENLKLQLKLAKFGSIISGFATRNTDMDLTIIPNCYINQIELLQFLQAFMKAEFKDKKNIQCEPKLVKTARIPVLKLKIKSNKGETFMDIIVNNILGVINSRFLSVYGSIKWIRHLGILVKLWAKKQDIVKEDMFSSYSFNLLLLHFLIQTKRVNLIMDSRSRNKQTSLHFNYKRIVKDQKQQFSVYYEFKKLPEQVTTLKRANLLQILTQFFEFYSEKGKHWIYQKSEQIITVDGSKQKQFDDSFMFTIKDPFDLRHNPGRVQASQSQRIIRLFTAAFETLKSKKHLADIQKLFE